VKFLILAAKLQKIIVILQRFYINNMEKKRLALRKLLEAVEKEILRKPDKKTLDRLSLLVGFQNWESFQDALHGETSADENYK
jgi:hypothetical protein